MIIGSLKMGRLPNKGFCLPVQLKVDKKGTNMAVQLEIMG